MDKIKNALITTFYVLYGVQMQIYWTVVITIGLGYLLVLAQPIIGSIFILISVLATYGDVKGRMFVEYKQIRREFVNSQDPQRVAEKWIRAQKFAACRRFATSAAIRDIKYARQKYHQMGYRWYHVFPDQFYKKMWSVEYWKKALFK